VKNPAAGYDRRAAYWLAAERSLQEAQKIRSSSAELPVEYWANLTEGHLLAALAQAPNGLMLPIAFSEAEERRQAAERNSTLMDEMFSKSKADKS